MSRPSPHMNPLNPGLSWFHRYLAARRVVRDQGAPATDVREPGELAAAAIPCATNIPLAHVQQHGIRGAATGRSRSRPPAPGCHGVSQRRARRTACQALLEAVEVRVKNLAGESSPGSRRAFRRNLVAVGSCEKPASARRSRIGRVLNTPMHLHHNCTPFIHRFICSPLTPTRVMLGDCGLPDPGGGKVRSERGNVLEARGAGRTTGHPS